MRAQIGKHLSFEERGLAGVPEAVRSTWFAVGSAEQRMGVRKCEQLCRPAADKQGMPEAALGMAHFRGYGVERRELRGGMRPGAARPAALNDLVFASLVFNFLEKGGRGVCVLKFLRGFCTFLPSTLINGYIYLKRYCSNFKYRFREFGQLLQFYFVCCLVSRKYEADTQISSEEVLKDWEMSVGEMNYLEALVINGLNYNLNITQKEYHNCFFNINNAYGNICKRD